MSKIILRKIRVADKKYFFHWWQDQELRKLTSGVLGRVSNKEIDKYFKDIFESKKDHHFMIVLDKKVIGHISLAERKNNWYETQIIIGLKNYRGKGYGSKAIRILVRKAKRLNISKIYLEVRPTNIRAICAYENCGFYKIKTVLYPKNKRLPKTLRMEQKQQYVVRRS